MSEWREGGDRLLATLTLPFISCLLLYSSPTHPQVLEHMKPIAKASFHEHVQQMHNNSDAGFEKEYLVRTSPSHHTPHTTSSSSSSSSCSSFCSRYPCSLTSPLRQVAKSITSPRTDLPTSFLVRQALSDMLLIVSDLLPSFL